MLWLPTTGGTLEGKTPSTGAARPDVSDNTAEAQQPELKTQTRPDPDNHQRHATSNKKAPAAKGGPVGALDRRLKDSSKPSRKLAVSRVKQQLEAQRELHRQREAVRKQRLHAALGAR
jgi:hypothetical protein